VSSGDRVPGTGDPPADHRAAGRHDLDDVRSPAGQWRGDFLTTTVQGTAPHPSGTEVPL
jgi:hypothetical protein